MLLLEPLVEPRGRGFRLGLPNFRNLAGLGASASSEPLREPGFASHVLDSLLLTIEMTGVGKGLKTQVR